MLSITNISHSIICTSSHSTSKDMLKVCGRSPGTTSKPSVISDGPESRTCFTKLATVDIDSNSRLTRILRSQMATGPGLIQQYSTLNQLITMRQFHRQTAASAIPLLSNHQHQLNSFTILKRGYNRVISRRLLVKDAARRSKRNLELYAGLHLIGQSSDGSNI